MLNINKLNKKTMSKKTELVDKLEAFLIENKSIKTETLKEIYPFLNDIRKQLTLTDVSQCACTSEETTGTTTVKCCNVCGKPAEIFWHCG